MRIITPLLVLGAALVPRAAGAQPRVPLYAVPVAAVDAPAPRTAALASDAWRDEDSGDSMPAMLTGGVLGAGAGVLAGWLVGAAVDGDAEADCYDFCMGPGLVVGTLAGEAVGMAAGVHLGNGRRGSFPVSMLASAGILAVGLAAGHEQPELLVALPVGQLLGTIWMERDTTRPR